MPDFDNSRWAEQEFSMAYRDGADGFLPWRNEFLHAALRYFTYFLGEKPDQRVLDLGCGDGLFAEILSKEDNAIDLTLVDGSADMLGAARQRLAAYPTVRYQRASFQGLLKEPALLGQYDFVFSSLAIHHLAKEEKTALYGLVFKHLVWGGHFLNFDVVLSPSEELEKWNMALWRDWITRHAQPPGREEFASIPQQYKDNLDNTPDTLDDQLAVLKKIGFQGVACHFQYSIFSLFGGRKEHES